MAPTRSVHGLRRRRQRHRHGQPDRERRPPRAKPGSSGRRRQRGDGLRPAGGRCGPGQRRRTPTAVNWSSSAFTQPQHGSVSRGPNGRLVYRPDDGYTGTDSFDYTIADGQGGTATARVTITVRAQPAPPRENLPPAPVGDQAGSSNRPPVPVDDRATTSRGRAVGITVLDGDSDPDGDELTVTAWTQPRHGKGHLHCRRPVHLSPESRLRGRGPVHLHRQRRTRRQPQRQRCRAGACGPDRAGRPRADRPRAARRGWRYPRPERPGVTHGAGSRRRIAVREGCRRGLGPRPAAPHRDSPSAASRGLGWFCSCAGVAGRRGTARSEDGA